MSKKDKIDDLLHKANHVEAKRGLLLDSLDQQLDQIDDEVGRLVREICEPLRPDADDYFYDAGGWECESEENPLPCCVYDEENDPAYDDCLFCHQPWERK